MEKYDNLISRQAAIDALKDMYHAAEKWGVEAPDDLIKARAESCMASIIEMKLRIENIPIAQKKGKWIWQGSVSEGCWVCSECKHKFYQGYGNENFCPNCGADMSEESNNAEIR